MESSIRMTVDDPDKLGAGTDEDRQEPLDGLEAQAGSGSDFGEFYVLYKGYVENYVRKLLYLSKCRSPAAHSEDVAGEVFTRAQKSLSTYKGVKGSYLNWVRTISRNQVYDHLRGPCTREVSLEALTSSTEEAGRLPFAEPQAPQENYDVMIWLQDKLKQLPERQRQVLLLIAHGYDYAEIGRMMGITANHARQLSFKARRMLDAED